MAKSEDIRVHADWPDHPKTMRLLRRGHSGAILSLLFLWCWARKHRTDGNLSGMDEIDIEAAARIPHDAPEGSWVAMMVEAGFIDRKPDGSYALHDWEDWQSWAMQSAKTSESGSRGAAIKYLKLEGRWSPGMEKWTTEDLKRARLLPGHSVAIAPPCHPYPLACPPSPPPSPAPAPKGQRSRQEKANASASELPAYAHAPSQAGRGVKKPAERNPGCQPYLWARWTEEERQMSNERYSLLSPEDQAKAAEYAEQYQREHEEREAAKGREGVSRDH